MTVVTSLIFAMEENLDNISQQTEEMEALTSIYGNQWKIDDKTGICSIEITKSVKFYITLVPEYPLKCLPKYELLAPGLSAKQKQQIDKEFKIIFENGGGGPLIYQMILAIEEVAKQSTTFPADEVSILKPHENDNLENISSVVSNTLIGETHKLDIVHGPIIEDRKSVFQGHVGTVHNKENVGHFMEALFRNRKIVHATHNITASRISLPNGIVLQDCDDDGEHRAAGRLLDLLQTLKLNNVMVVVSRWYGGIKLGPDRFRHINNAARQALIAAGFIKS